MDKRTNRKVHIDGLQVMNFILPPKPGGFVAFIFTIQKLSHCNKIQCGIFFIINYSFLASFFLWDPFCGYIGGMRRRMKNLWSRERGTSLPSLSSSSHEHEDLQRRFQLRQSQSKVEDFESRIQRQREPKVKHFL